MSELKERPGLGWLPDYPDFRDYTAKDRAVNTMLNRIGVDKPLEVSLPETTDLRAWCSAESAACADDRRGFDGLKCMLMLG